MTQHILLHDSAQSVQPSAGSKCCRLFTRSNRRVHILLLIIVSIIISITINIIQILIINLLPLTDVCSGPGWRPKETQPTQDGLAGGDQAGTISVILCLCVLVNLTLIINSPFIFLVFLNLCEALCTLFLKIVVYKLSCNYDDDYYYYIFRGPIPDKRLMMDGLLYFCFVFQLNILSECQSETDGALFNLVYFN